jgi:hypothetical protein
VPANDYHFVTRWRLPVTPEQVSDVLGDTGLLSRIWPSVYGGAIIVHAGGEHSLGRVVRMRTKGHLAYVLRWAYKVVDSRYPYGYTIEARGDLAGWGVWTLEPDGDHTSVTYDWRVRANKPLLRLLSPFLKPLFARNHDQVMADGESAIRAELQRRAATER